MWSSAISWPATRTCHAPARRRAVVRAAHTNRPRRAARLRLPPRTGVRVEDGVALESRTDVFAAGASAPEEVTFSHARCAAAAAVLRTARSGYRAALDDVPLHSAARSSASCTPLPGRLRPLARPHGGSGVDEFRTRVPLVDYARIEPGSGGSAPKAAP